MQSSPNIKPSSKASSHFLYNPQFLSIGLCLNHLFVLYHQNSDYHILSSYLIVLSYCLSYIEKIVIIVYLKLHFFLFV